MSLGLQSGVLIAVPIPEEHAAAGQQIEEAIRAAVTEAKYTLFLKLSVILKLVMMVPFFYFAEIFHLFF